MATYSTGITVTWGGTPFVEVTGLSWSFGGGSSKGRSVVWTDDVGSVNVECLDGTNVSTAEYGQRKQLSISGGGQSLTAYALYESVGVTSEVNGVTRYTVTFRLLDG